MTMDSKIQPILCCAGEAVAGRPTQFLMERAFAANHSDWRVITVEIRTEDFQSALDGMRAMKFKALRFFPEFQTLAASCLQAGTGDGLAPITSALWQGDRWTSWDNQGFGLLDLISEIASPKNLLLWLHGRSRLTQSLVKAMQVSEFEPGKLLWSEAASTNGARSVESEANDIDAVAPLLSSTEAEQTVAQLLNEESSFSHLAIIGESLAGQLELISQLKPGVETNLILATNQLLPRQQANEAWPVGKVSILSEVDQLIAAEAYDFRRWSGRPADVDMLRDAYDEYADF